MTPTLADAARELRIVFVGARVVGRTVLEALLDAGARVAGLLALDDAKAGVTVAHASFAALAADRALHWRTFVRLDDPEVEAWVADLRPDLGLVVGVSQLLGPRLLAVPRLGFVGMHPTLLPEGRGRAPIPWTIIRGLRRTGVSLFHCAAGADTGDLLLQEEVPVHYEDTCAVLGARTDAVAARLAVEAVRQLADGRAARLPQDEARASVWPRRRPEDGVVSWNGDGRAVYDWVRALTHPYPGAFTFRGGRKLFLWAARESADERRGAPGEVLAVLPHGVLVATAGAPVLLTRVQWEGAAETGAGDAGLAPGDLLGR